MLLGLVFAALVAGAGWSLLRLLGLARGLAGIGLAPAAGLALLAVLTTWAGVLGLPAAFGGLLLLVAGSTGVALAARTVSSLSLSLWERVGVRAQVPALRSGRTEDRLAAALLGAALLVPALLLGSALAGVEVPLSSHDGANHVEIIHALRGGARWGGWYPPGYHATVAALLQLVPWLDTAQGAFQASLGLAVLAPLAAFGLGYAVWRTPLVAAAGALLVALTFRYPYDPQVWGGWPMAASVLLLLGLWATTVHYLNRVDSRQSTVDSVRANCELSTVDCRLGMEPPGPGWLCLGAVLAAAILLTHGTEVYSALVGLAVLLVAAGKRVVWLRLGRDLSLALGLALVLAAPYVPSLVGWARAGGAAQVGLAALDPASGEMSRALPNDPLFFVGEALGAGSIFLIPARALLLLAGARWAGRARRGRALVALWVVFVALAVIFANVQAPAIQQVFALTYPWGLKDRLGQLQAILAALLGGAGLVALARALPGLRQRWPRLLGLEHPAAWRRTVTACLLLAFFLGEGSAVTVYKTLSFASQLVVTYSADDAAAMAWLRQHAQPGEVLANDGSADAGLWAPYKAGVAVLVPRSIGGPGIDAQRLVLANVAALERVPEARAAACGLGVRYVYRGAAGTAYEPRHFPSLEDLRRSTGLEQVFASGEAAIFRVRLACPPY
ncbi:MAG: hypothetical protein HY690_08085 [Chloroflexi bacterium]|nr:hypothetical protein [Chloroflexota bacterium]